MNARLYDPVLGRFFSPDPQVQSPFSTQGFNRYSYCGNNPVMYVDEDGELAWFIPLIAAAIGGVVNVAVNVANGNLDGYDFWGTIGRGAAFFAGAVQGSSACFGPGWMAAGGALAGGVNSWLGGGDLLAGAVTGGFASAFGGMAGQWTSRGANVLINGFNITSPVLSGHRRFVTTMTDPNGNVTTQYADYGGRKVQVTDSINGATRTTLMHYDNLGQLDSVSDPEGFKTTYSYDMLGRMTKRIHPDAGETRYTYDNAGNLTKEINPLGQIFYDYTYYRLLKKRYYMTFSHLGIVQKLRDLPSALDLSKTL